jgi:hypothetical protein
MSLMGTGLRRVLQTIVVQAITGQRLSSTDLGRAFPAEPRAQRRFPGFMAASMRGPKCCDFLYYPGKRRKAARAR